VANVSATLDGQTVSSTVALMGIYDVTTQKGFDNIQDAVNDSSTLNGDTIEITNGTYIGTSNLNLIVGKNLSIIGNGTVVIDAQGQGNVFTIVNGVNVAIFNMNFINGNVVYNGGVIYNQGTLTMTNCNFTGNIANCGGAICNEGTLTVTNSTFISNSATWDGGAIESAAAAILTVSNSTFTNNTACHVAGAIINWQGTMTVTGSNFTGNTATSEGGAISNYGNAQINFNRIVGNSNCGLYSTYYIAANTYIDATNNWWGTNNPNTESNDVEGWINYYPWIVLTINSPAYIIDGKAVTPLNSSFSGWANVSAAVYGQTAPETIGFLGTDTDTVF
ncbi:MAG: hypothetical protein K8E24_015780, partial [Methanobacterium paludis]|nr:hypothetical protein [Methanobacterium paludis]